VACDSPTDGIATSEATWGSWRSDAPSHTAPLPRFAWLFDIQRNGRIGSPSVGLRQLASSVESFDVKAGRPLPGRRTLPTGEPGSSRTFSPRAMISRARPVARDAVIPLCPAVLAAPNRRRARSFRSRPTVAYRCASPMHLTMSQGQPASHAGISPPWPHRVSYPYRVRMPSAQIGSRTPRQHRPSHISAPPPILPPRSR
jgi:hypothetical protein